MTDKRRLPTEQRAKSILFFSWNKNYCGKKQIFQCLFLGRNGHFFGTFSRMIQFWSKNILKPQASSSAESALSIRSIQRMLWLDVLMYLHETSIMYKLTAHDQQGLEFVAWAKHERATLQKICCMGYTWKSHTAKNFLHGLNMKEPNCTKCIFFWIRHKSTCME
jgi:hypothetical protein